MAEFLTAVGAFLSGAYQLLSGLGHLALILVFIMVGMALLGLIGSKMKAGTKKATKKHGLFRVHDTTDFDVSTAFKCRMKIGAMTADPADDENAPPIPDALCAAEKPVAVLKFVGDTMATSRKAFSRLVDEVIINKEKFGGAVIVVDCPGGGVSVYGHMYAEVLRIKNAGLYLRICVDNVAASGGYLMSLPGDCIQAAPLATIGSIGVVAEFLNFHDFLTGLGVTPLTMTAGERKRTLTQFGEVTEPKKEAFRAQLVSIHEQFKALVKKHRPNAKMDVVCEGDHWTAQETVALGLGLVDEIGTSSEYLLKLNTEVNVVYLSEKSSPFQGGLLKLVTGSIDHVLTRIEQRTNRVS